MRVLRLVEAVQLDLSEFVTENDAASDVIVERASYVEKPLHSTLAEVEVACSQSSP